MPQFCKLFDANYTILATQRGDGTMPPKYAPALRPLRDPQESLVCSTAPLSQSPGNERDCYIEIKLRLVKFPSSNVAMFFLISSVSH